MRTFVIAEAGTAFGRTLTAALDMVEIARAAGADAIKMQWWSSPTHLAEVRGYGLDLFKQHMTPLEWIQAVREAAILGGLEFLCTVYLPEDIPTIAPLVTRFKIGSLEARDEAFVQAHREFGKPVIVSTGAMSEADLTRLGMKFRYLVKDPIKLLHCVSGYPAQPAEVNFRLMRHYGMEGFSDHTRHEITGALAVAHGAQILEVHFRHPLIDAAHPDFSVSHLPGALRQYVRNVRIAETMDGTPKKAIQPSEHWVTTFSRN